MHPSVPRHTDGAEHQHQTHTDADHHIGFLNDDYRPDTRHPRRRSTPRQMDRQTVPPITHHNELTSALHSRTQGSIAIDALGPAGGYRARNRDELTELLRLALEKSGKARKSDIDLDMLARLLTAVHEVGLAQSLVEPDALPSGEFERTYLPTVLRAVFREGDPSLGGAC